MERKLLADYEAALDLIATRPRRPPNTASPSRSPLYPEEDPRLWPCEANAEAATLDAAIRREAFLTGAKGIAQAAE